MNKVFLIGRLTKDPELKKTPNDISVSSFSIAVNRRFKREGEPTADFFNCVAWRESAEKLCQYMRKGSLICVEGSIQTRTYANRDNINVTVFEIQVDSVTFLESKKSQEASSTTNYNDSTMDDLTTSDEHNSF